MNTQSNSSYLKINRSMPPGIIIPELVYEDLDKAVAWLCQAFGFKERLHFRSHRCQLVLGEASLIAKTTPDLIEAHNNQLNRMQPRPKKTDHQSAYEDVDQHAARPKSSAVIDLP
jgi:hypothetical protein